MRFRSKIILNSPQYYFHMAAILKNDFPAEYRQGCPPRSCAGSEQNIVRVVHLEVVQGGPLNTLVPNTCFHLPAYKRAGR